MDDTKIRVFFVDDHQMFIDSMVRLLQRSGRFQFAGSASNGADALGRIPKVKPDVVLLDVNMPGMSGLEVAGQLKKTNPEIKILVLTGFSNYKTIADAIGQKVNGFISKNKSGEDICLAIERVTQGEFVMIVEMEEYRPPEEPEEASASNLLATLTPRQKEVACLAVKGLKNNEIAERLKLHLSAVETLRATAMHKLQVNNIAGLIRVAAQLKLCD
jgi:DNA-binding NarL/FixJ family response regulator